MAATPASRGDHGPALRYRLLFEQHPDAMYELDAEGRLVACNAALQQVTGYSFDELAEMRHTPFVHPEDAPAVLHNVGRALAGEERSFQIRGTHRNGSSFVAQVRYLPITLDGEVLGVYGIARDVTQAVEAQEALGTSERRFRGLFEGAGSGIAITGLDGRFIDANPAFLTMLGYELDELQARDLPAITHPDDRDDSVQRIRDLVTGDEPSFVVEQRYLGTDGETVWVRATMSLIRDVDGRPLHLSATTEDITRAKLSTERLQRSEQLQRLAGELALVGGWSIDAETSTVYWSEEVFRILDAPVGAEPTLEECLALYPDADRERLTAAIEACLDEGTPFDLELQIDTFAGRRIPVRSIGEAELDDVGRVVRVIGAFQDISELAAESARTADVARRLTATFESVSDGVVLLDDDWRITFANPRAAHILQRSRTALVGRDLWEEFPEAVGSEVDDLYRRARETQQPQQLAEYGFAPLGIWLEINAYPNDDGLALYFSDITQQRRDREAIAQRERTLRRQAELLDAAQDAILVRDLDHRITYWNRSAERVYGWTRDEALGTDARELIDGDRDDFDAAMRSLLAEGSWTGQVRHRDRHGATLVLDASWTLVRDDDGEPDAVLAINTDVTEQHQIEQHLLRAQRMESIGTLAGGVAHDLNNVLAPILLATELLRDHELDPQADGLLETVQTSAKRGADLVAQVLSFARGVEGRRTDVDVSRLLTDIRTIIRDTFPKHIRVELDVDPRLGSVLGDSTQIQQVVLNLAVNARDAMPGGGSLRIAARNVTVDAHDTAAALHAAPGRYVLIEVEDDGVGMPAEVRDRVFEPFFTTKPQGSGTGLGLSTAAAIVRSHGGLLQVDSEPGDGSRFALTLPRVERLAGGGSDLD